MNVILEQHNLRKERDIPFNGTIIFVLRNFNPDISSDLVYQIQDVTLLFFFKITSLKQLVNTCTKIPIYEDIFFIDDRIEEFIISEEYIRVIDEINKKYNIDGYKMTKSEIVEKVNNKNIFNEIKGKLSYKNIVLDDISWLNFENIHKLILSLF